MVINHLTPVQKIEIWQPRYKDRTIMVATFKVGTHNEIIFTKAKHLMNTTWYLSGATIKKHPINSNGKIPCYVVPVDALEPLERHT